MPKRALDPSHGALPFDAAGLPPMLARTLDALPEGAPGSWLFEPKWDGFRAIAMRSAEDLLLQSRDLKPLNRYFPELEAALQPLLPAGCALDGEIVIAGPHGLDFDALLQRIHPADSRVQRLARETPASFVAFDLLALDGEDLRERPQAERRLLLQALLADSPPPLHLTPMTLDPAVARAWHSRFEGAGLDGVMAKAADAPYLTGERAMFKIKHVRTADCVVGGLRWRAGAPQPEVASLLLGLHDAAGVLQHVGSASGFSQDVRRRFAELLAPLVLPAGASHPWHGEGPAGQRRPGAPSRWSSAKDLAWVALVPERVCEVRYDHLQGDRFRHVTRFERWRPDKPPADCGYDQLATTPPYELQRVFGSTSAG